MLSSENFPASLLKRVGFRGRGNPPTPIVFFSLKYSKSYKGSNFLSALFFFTII